MEQAMKPTKLPKTDSIRELALFWDTHDLTEFDGDLVEVTDPVFVEEDSINLHLHSRDAKAVRRLAESKGLSEAELIGQWVSQKLRRRKRAGKASD